MVLTHILDNAANPLILTMVQLTVYVVSFSIPILRHLIQDIKSYFSPPPPLPRPTMGNSSSNLVNHGGRAVRGSVISVWSQWSGHADIERDFHDEPVHLPVYSSTDSSKSINDSPAFEKCVV